MLRCLEEKIATRELSKAVTGLINSEAIVLNRQQKAAIFDAIRCLKSIGGGRFQIIAPNNKFGLNEMTCRPKTTSVLCVVINLTLDQSTLDDLRQRIIFSLGANDDSDPQETGSDGEIPQPQGDDGRSDSTERTIDYVAKFTPSPTQSEILCGVTEETADKICCGTQKTDLGHDQIHSIIADEMQQRPTSLTESSRPSLKQPSRFIQLYEKVLSLWECCNSNSSVED